MATAASRQDCTRQIENVGMQDKLMVGDVPVVVNYACEHDVRVTDEEARAYIARGNRRNPHSTVVGLQLDVDGQDVGIHYQYGAVPFDRIRRITGYLVGTLDRFNDGKRSEERDRVKHSVPPACC